MNNTVIHKSDRLKDFPYLRFFSFSPRVVKIQRRRFHCYIYNIFIIFECPLYIVIKNMPGFFFFSKKEQWRDSETFFLLFKGNKRNFKEVNFRLFSRKRCFHL